ncbi:glycosyltransferase family 4 protein [Halobellus sp. EA9]|uniref:glycosyltransferase family 4 protein n=1 Tax=Halobellus sp. EA9 TaxID=3421647 RepID=UPI003EBCA9F1
MDHSKTDVTSFVREVIGIENGKIAICNTFFTGAGGRSRVIEQQAKALSRDSYDVKVFALVGKQISDVNFDQTVRLSVNNKVLRNLCRFAYPLTPFFLTDLEELGRYDLIITHDGFPFSLLSNMVNQLFDTPYVYWYHHLWDNLNEYYHGIEGLYSELDRYLERQSFFIKQADYLVAVSDASRSELQQASGRDNVYVVPNTIDESRFENPSDISEVLPAECLSGNEDTLLFVGSINPQKNISELFEVLRLVNQKYGNVRLLIAGRPESESYFQSIRHKAPDNVVFLGFLENDDLAAVYEFCDVYVTCSTHESFNLPLLEAQYFGTTVIAYDTKVHANVATGASLVPKNETEMFAKRVINAL